jgi:hypothetical protein
MSELAVAEIFFSELTRRKAIEYECRCVSDGLRKVVGVEQTDGV